MRRASSRCRRAPHQESRNRAPPRRDAAGVSTSAAGRTPRSTHRSLATPRRPPTCRSDDRSGRGVSHDREAVAPPWSDWRRSGTPEERRRLRNGRWTRLRADGSGRATACRSQRSRRYFAPVECPAQPQLLQDVRFDSRARERGSQTTIPWALRFEKETIRRACHDAFLSAEINTVSIRPYCSSASENAFRYSSSETFWPFQSPLNAVRLPPASDWSKG